MYTATVADITLAELDGILNSESVGKHGGLAAAIAPELDEMTDLALVTYVFANEDATEMEFELADRLQCAMDEIDLLVKERAELLGTPAPVQH